MTYDQGWGQPQPGPAPQPPAWGYSQQPGWGQPPQQPAPPQQQGWGQPPQQPAQQQRRPVGPPPDPDELMSGGHKAAVFPDQAFGTVVGGRIVGQPVTTQQLDFDSRQPKFYDDGNPMWQVVVAVQAQPPGDDDDGIRAFYIKAQMKRAVQEAVRRAGAPRLEVGGELHIRYVRDEPNSRGRGKDKKIYEARYTAPAGPAPAPPAARPTSAPISGLPMNPRPGTRAGAATAFDDTPPF